ncbi:MAG TPA: choice-of-anchor D domain-containing protein [Vicinamibacterales bacterium]
MVLSWACLTAPTAAQSVVTTVVGNPEVIAVAVDRNSGAVYFATDRPGAIYRLSGTTTTRIAGLAGGSTGDDVPALQAAVFPGRNGLAIDAGGSIFFSEPSTHQIRRIDVASGRVVTVAGNQSRRVNPQDIEGDDALFTYLAAPGALAFQPGSGDLFVADEAWDIVYRISTEGGGRIDGTADTVVYLAAGGNPGSPSIFLDGDWYNPFGYAGDNGPAIDAKLNHPRGLAFDGVGNLFIADTGNNVVRRVDTSEIISTVAGTTTPGFSGDGGAATAGRLFMPTGLAFDGVGNLFIADTSNQRVRVLLAASNQLATVAGVGVAGHAGDGAAAIGAALAFPTGVAVDAAGNLLVVDSQNNRLRRVSLAQTISSAVQTGPDYVGDGLPGGSAVNQPSYLVIDHAGNLFFSDSGNARVRRRDAITHAVTTVAGSGVPGSTGDHSPAVAARLNCPAGLAFGQGGDLFVADPCASVVRRIAAGADGLVTGAGDEIISTFAGTGVRYGISDGDHQAATTAALNGPVSVAVDSRGSVWIGENDVHVVRVVTANGSIDTFDASAGSRGLLVDADDNVAYADDFNGQISCNGDGLVYWTDFPSGSVRSWGGLAIDALGRVYVSEDGRAHSIYRLTPDDGRLLCAGDALISVNRVAGLGSDGIGYSGDGGPATSATFNHPEGLAIDAAGALFIADSGNGVIRRVQGSAGGVTLDATTLDFGAQALGAVSTPITVTATASGPASFGTTAVAGANPGDFTIVADSCASRPIAAGQTCQIVLAFEPTGLGPRSATLQVNDDAAGSPQTVTLSGSGVTPLTAAQLAPTAVAFGQIAVGSASSGVTVTLGSTGSGPLSVTGITLGGNQPGDFAISANTCGGAVLPPGQSCSLIVTFAPILACASTATLSFSDNAAGGQQAVLLSGTGVARAAAPFQGALHCTSVAAQPRELAPAADGSVLFDEAGSRDSPPGIGRVSATAGVQEVPGAVQSGGWIPSGLTSLPDGSYAYLETRAPGFPAWLDIASGNSKQQYPQSGVLGPVGSGPDDAFWYAKARACGGDVLVTKYAAGKAPVDYSVTTAWLAANARSICADPSFVTAGPDGTTWIGLANTDGNPSRTPSGFLRLATNGLAIDFTATPSDPRAAALGADGNLYALLTSGNGVCSLARFAVAANSGEIVRTPIALALPVWTVGCSGITAGADGRIWALGSTFDGSAFIPSLIALDTANGVVTPYPVPAQNVGYLAGGSDEGIWFNAPPGAVGRFDIGGGPARGFVTPRLLGFPSSPVGVASPARAVYIRSTGTAPLAVSSVTLAAADGSNFVIDDRCSGTTLAPGTSCVVWVVSRPTSAGSHAATLVINDNDAFSPQVVRLEEFTPQPAPAVAPASAGFPNTTVGTSSQSTRLTLTNPATRSVAVVSVALGGINAADFSIVSDQCSNMSVPSGGTCVVTVAFTPAAAGPRTAVLTFTDAANPSTQIVNLTGTAQVNGNGGGGSGGTGACGCTATGLFVDPVVVPPVQTAPPAFPFRLVVGGPLNAPTSLTIRTPANAVVMTFTAPPVTTWPDDWSNAYGFSPDGKLFVVHYQAGGVDTIELYNLVGAHPATKVWSSPIPILSGGSTNGSVGFSPLGTYLLTAQLQSTPPPISDTLILNIASGAGPVVSHNWQPIHAPVAKPYKGASSQFWGFAPDDSSFTYVALTATSPMLTLVSLPSNTDVQQLPFTSSLATWVQFSPCGDVLGLVDQHTDPTDPAPANPVTITLYSTRTPAPALKSAGGLPATAITLSAGPATFTAQVAGWPAAIDLGPNAAAAGCPAASTSGNGGGATAPDPPSAPLLTLASPPTVAFEGVPYTYTFAALGSPDPTFSLKMFGPSWLSIDEDSGHLTGTPPVGTTSFDYSVVATNAVGFDDTQPFHVTVTPQVAPLGDDPGPGGPRVDDEPTPTAADAAAVPTASTNGSPSEGAAAQTTLLLPNGRGQISLPADVTPAISTFAYTETDTPTGPVGALRFAGLDFTLTAVDALSGAPVTTLVDAPLATLVFRDTDLLAARIRDASRLSLYWWSGTAWVDQSPCTACAVDLVSHTITVRLTRLGEYMLAAIVPTPVLTVTAPAIQATAGSMFAGTVATFPPIGAQDTLNEYSATVHWGDNQVSVGGLLSSGGTFVVTGTHTWAAGGTYPVAITVFSGGFSQTTQSTAVVTAAHSAPQFTAAAPPLTATAGAAYSYTFAASGIPAPAFALSNAPAWLTLDATTGALTGTPPSGTTTFNYSVVASNGVTPDAVVGPFAVTVTAAANKSADLSVTLSAPGATTKGSTFAYTVIVKNNGPAGASNALVALLAGPGTSLVSATPQPAIGTNDVWAWCVPTLASGQSLTFTVRVKVSRAGLVVAAAAVVADTRDPKPLNNAATVATTVK